MIDFSHRHSGPELMDRDDIPAEDLFQNYRELHAVNKLLGGYRITIKGLRMLLNQKGRTYSILDVGCGGGDMLNEVSSWAGRKSFSVQLSGIDLSEAAIDYSKKKNGEVNWIREDVFDHLTSGVKYDVIMSTLFMHHFSEEKISKLLTLMIQSCNGGIIINDLQRNPLAYHSIKLLTRIFSKSYLVKHDAPLSVQRGFISDEWKEIFRKANLQWTVFSWQWAFRYLLVVKK